MKIAIMQPYLFPYIGYFQLIESVDLFVLYDDVNYKKKGWINRNNLLINGESFLITFPVKKASQNKLINELDFAFDHDYKFKLLKLIKRAYYKAPYFDIVYPLLIDILCYKELNLSKFIAYSLEIIKKYLSVDTKIIYSSEIEKCTLLKGEAKIIDICKRLNATSYINLIGGYELYSKESFLEENIELFFLKSQQINYLQFTKPFVPNLSIIDLLMFNSRERVKEDLKKYTLIS